jgi:hypothetical protein
MNAFQAVTSTPIAASIAVLKAVHGVVKIEVILSHRTFQMAFRLPVSSVVKAFQAVVKTDMAASIAVLNAVQGVSKAA